MVLSNHSAQQTDHSSNRKNWLTFSWISSLILLNTCRSGRARKGKEGRGMEPALVRVTGTETFTAGLGDKFMSKLVK